MSKNINYTKRESWGSSFGFIMAAAGSAVGLGNIWKFPYVAGESGGAVFLFIYLICALLLGFTVMLCEHALGRNSQQDAVGTFKKIAPGKKWWLVGAIGVLASFIILSFYSVVAGWTLAYIFKSVIGSLAGLQLTEYSGFFSNFISNPVEPIIWQSIFMIITVIIVVAGVQSGIEKWSKVLMPALFAILLLIIVRSLTLEGSMEGVKFFLSPDFSKINSTVVLSALGQAFFSLSLGVGAMITYGSYLNKRSNIPSAAFMIIALGILVAVLAGLAIFPAVFATGMSPSGGPGLIFMVLPAVFSKMPFGHFFEIIFFILLSIAALTSAISLLEVLVAFIKDQLKWTRKKAAIISGVLAFIWGIPSSLSQGIWSEFLFKLPGQKPKVFFDLMDFFASNILMPIGGICVCIFTAYIWKTNNAITELSNNGKYRYSWLPLWGFLVKYIAPIVIFLVLLQGLGILKS
ncbi:neurotransmitter:Na+ symporter, NSS family [Desulfonispora thiosulfatigenes DSM 11270]|uniref:Transporter n=1 Tax=Desulfonispora thiosulfatigenes DSM 11270 TaxID=656914 RepID=A0A1W1VNW7_DESTI|nr:sodium-dependent transporter [Desulfonispora thiosulfatigenes]SMB95038.1 neurotransmitter:Na+ symporter, NSS family [Desulfonispora thiosulfatigenes DSM 11270]